MTHDGEYWNQKYREGLPSLTRPDPFFLRAYEQYHATVPTAACALDVAGGLGRHALHLAQRGWRVTVVDISGVALAQLEKRAKALGVSLELHLGDAADLCLQDGSLDMVVLFYHLDRRLFPGLLAALRPGGLLLYKGRTCLLPENEADEAHPLLQPDELLTLARPLEVLEHQQRGLAAPNRGVVEYVGRKRLPATESARGPR